MGHLRDLGCGYGSVSFISVAYRVCSPAPTVADLSTMYTVLPYDSCVIPGVCPRINTTRFVFATGLDRSFLKYFYSLWLFFSPAVAVYFFSHCNPIKTNQDCEQETGGFNAFISCIPEAFFPLKSCRPWFRCVNRCTDWIHKYVFYLVYSKFLFHKWLFCLWFVPNWKKMRWNMTGSFLCYFNTHHQHCMLCFLSLVLGAR